MDDFLMHYGRKGMKWYQHIYGEVQSGAKYAQKGGESKRRLGIFKKRDKPKQEAEQTKPKQKRVEDMSDDELRQIINRANLEKQYRDLQPKKVNVGREIVKRVLLPVMEQQAKNLLNAKIGQMVSEMTKQAKTDSAKKKR